MKNAVKVLIFTLVFIIAASGAVFGFIKYNTSDFAITEGNKKGTAVIVGYNGSSVNIDIPKKVKGKKIISIGEGAFESTNIKSVIIPETVTEIEEAAFKDCKKLQKITFNGALEKIGENAFNNCDSLTEFTIPASLKTLGAAPFSDCDNLKNIKVEDDGNFLFDNGVLYSADKTVAYFALKNVNLAKYEFPSEVNEIAPFFFFGRDEINSVKLPDGLKLIDESLFALCKNLKNVEIPDGVKIIGNSAFLGCVSLDKLYIPDSVKSFDKFCFPVAVNKDKEDETAKEIFNDEFTLVVNKNSSAERYAKEQGIKYELAK